MANIKDIKANLNKAEAKEFKNHSFTGVNWSEMELSEAIKMAKKLLKMTVSNNEQPVESVKENKIYMQIFLESGSNFVIETNDKCIGEGGVDVEKLLKYPPTNWEKRLAYIDTENISAIILLKN